MVENEAYNNEDKEETTSVNIENQDGEEAVEKIKNKLPKLFNNRKEFFIFAALCIVIFAVYCNESILAPFFPTEVSFPATYPEADPRMYQNLWRREERNCKILKMNY